MDCSDKTLIKLLTQQSHVKEYLWPIKPNYQRDDSESGALGLKTIQWKEKGTKKTIKDHLGL